MAMQDNFDIWHARQTLNIETVEKVDFQAA